MIHLERYGDGGTAYLCLHGWGGSHTTYAPLAAHLPPDAVLYSADLPGCGRSPVLPSWTADAVGDAIAEAAAAIPQRELTVVGNCSGAVFGLLAAQRLEPRVQRIVLVDAFAFLPWYFKVFTHPVVGAAAYHSTFANPLGRWLTNASLRGRRQADTHMTGHFKDADHTVALEYLRLLDRLGTVRRFADVRPREVDLIFGGRSFQAVKTSIPLWQGLWPHARVWPIAGAGHLPLEETPADVARIVFGAHGEQ